jgi:hypothetical protein
VRGERERERDEVRERKREKCTGIKCKWYMSILDSVLANFLRSEHFTMKYYQKCPLLK